MVPVLLIREAGLQEQRKRIETMGRSPKMAARLVYMAAVNWSRRAVGCVIEPMIFIPCMHVSVFHERYSARAKVSSLALANFDWAHFWQGHLRSGIDHVTHAPVIPLGVQGCAAVGEVESSRIPVVTVGDMALIPGIDIHSFLEVL